MKKLEKLNDKKIAGIEKIQGGLRAMESDLSMSDGGGTVVHEATHVVRTGHYVCDHTPDR